MSNNKTKMTQESKELLLLDTIASNQLSINTLKEDVRLANYQLKATKRELERYREGVRIGHERQENNERFIARLKDDLLKLRTKTTTQSSIARKEWTRDLMIEVNNRISAAAVAFVKRRKIHKSNIVKIENRIYTKIREEYGCLNRLQGLEAGDAEDVIKNVIDFIENF